MIQSFLLIWYLEFTLWVWIFRTISFENNLFTVTHPLHFIAGTMVDPHKAQHRNNRIKIHILQMETQLQMNFILNTNLYWNSNRCILCCGMKILKRGVSIWKRMFRTRKMYKELVIQTPLVFTQLLPNQIWQSKQRN